MQTGQGPIIVVQVHIGLAFVVSLEALHDLPPCRI
jgi:hypothetical protein